MILNLGVGAAAGLGPKASRIPKNDEREVCLIKYSITNKNKIHDLRIQLYDTTVPGDGTRPMTAAGAHKSIIASISVGLLSLISVLYA